MSATIAHRNDALRGRIPCIEKPDALVFTPGVAALNGEVVADILMKVKTFNDFNVKNDPWGEHDFGSFEHQGEEVFFKIDDYRGMGGCRLVLTVMLAEEY